MSLKAVVNANIVTVGGIIWDGTILIDGEEISAFGKDISVPGEAEIIDAGGAYAGPGFVDIHVHGGGNYHTCHHPMEASEYFLRHGETTILATPSYNNPKEEFIECIRTVKKANGKARNIRGLYLEGPYTNPKYGAHADTNPWRRPIKPEDYIPIVDEAGDLAKVWTVAPEREGIVDFVKYVRKVNPNTVIALGHSKATPEQIRAMGKYRPTLMTHTMNATGRVNDAPGLRGYGPDEYCFREPDMYAELISDSCAVHVSADMQQLLLHTKGLNRTLLITDSTCYKGQNPPQYSHVTDLNYDPKGGIAGSRLTMDKACRNIMASTNCGIAQAFVMASTNPARVIGMDDEIGSIDVGKKADIVIVDDKFNVKDVILRGERVE